MNDDKIFIQDFEGNSKKGLIFVDDDSDVIIEQDAPTSDTEVSSASTSERAPHPHPHKWRWIALSIFASVVFCFAAYACWRLYNYYYNIGGRRKFLPGHGAPPCREAGTWLVILHQIPG